MLGSPSPEQSETLLTPVAAPADGTSTITLTTTVRNSEGHFLPGRAISWTAVNSDYVFDLSSAVTDEYGVARVQVSSVTAATDTVAVVADGILIGEPTVQFTALPDTELSLEVTISTISTSAVIGDTVSFSIGVRNPADSTDTASSIELSGNLFETLQLDPLAPGEATVTGVQYIVTEEDLPELLLSVKVTASGAANPSVLVTGNSAVHTARQPGRHRSESLRVNR